jgi:hypothetical protein
MSDIASLPGTIDGTVEMTASRYRQDNLPTDTSRGEFSEAHHRALAALDTIQSTVDLCKITGGSFSGKPLMASGRTSVSFTKFFINLRSVAQRSVSACPAQIGASAHMNNIFREFKPREELPEFITVLNEHVFDILLNSCDGEALNIVLRYHFSDDNPTEEKKDGRRALFALLQTYEPVSTNAGNNAKMKLENFRFDMNKEVIQDQLTLFHVAIQTFESARAHKLDPLELWTYVVSSIRGRGWGPFRLVISMQAEFKQQKSFWLLDQLREYVLAIEDDEDDDDAPPVPRKKSVLNSVKVYEDSSTTAELYDTVNRLAATVAAITTNKETSSRVKDTRVDKRGDDRPYDPKMGPCRFCGGGHRHRDCHTLKTALPKPLIPPRAGAVKAAKGYDSTPGFLMGVAAIEDDSCPTRTSSFISFMAVLTALLWLVIAGIIVLSHGNITIQNNLRCKVTRGGSLAAANDTYCGFGVDSCASHHICDDQSKFSSIDFTRTKTFEVVHGERITSSGVGNVTLNVATTSGITKEVVLTDVHYMPQQRMCLISVGKAMTSQGFSSPDFKNLTWEVDKNCTLKMMKTNGTFQLDASVKFWKWTSSGIKVERQGAQH